MEATSVIHTLEAKAMMLGADHKNPVIFITLNLAGEVVVDYSTRLKNALGAEMLWVNGYMNEVPCYIASERVIEEGGYEAESSMYFYDKPSPFSTEIEDMIVHAVLDLRELVLVAE